MSSMTNVLIYVALSLSILSVALSIVGAVLSIRALRRGGDKH